MRGSKLLVVVAVAVAAGFFGGRAWTGEGDGDGPACGMDPALMQPGPEHQRMAELAGSWDVAGEFTQGGQSMKTESKATFEMILGGRYLVQKVEGDAMVPGGEPFEGLAIEGYDKVAKQYFSTWFDNMGTGHMDTTGQASADGKTLTMSGEADFGQGPMKFREVMTRTSADAFTMEMFASDGQHEGEQRVMKLSYTRSK